MKTVVSPWPEVVAGATVNAVDFFAALGGKVRWPIIQMLASGRPMSATEVASALHRDFDGVSKHLRILREAGVIASTTGDDRRMVLFQIPAENRPEPGILDYGFCRVRIANEGYLIL
ncbi:MAG: winged helix-turn-helix domain-containing protein [Chthoniobacteraceae bacterium]